MNDHHDMGNNPDTEYGSPAAIPGRYAQSPQVPSIIFDVDGLLNRVEQDRAIAREIADVFLQDVPRQLDAVKLAFLNKNADALRRAAHSLKGASACAGANLVRDNARQLEVASSDVDFDRIADVIAAFQSQVAAYRDLLELTLPRFDASES
jgi:HPt (histidine-containing phosphotransfer) domain-containing protein